MKILSTLVLSLGLAIAQEDTETKDPKAKAGAKPAEKEKKEEKKKTSKKNPDDIGERDVSKGVNFYSLEKEIALGKGLAQDIERSAKIVDDPVVAEYINRVGQNLVRNSDAKVPFTIKVVDFIKDTFQCSLWQDFIA